MKNGGGSMQKSLLICTLLFLSFMAISSVSPRNTYSHQVVLAKDEPLKVDSHIGKINTETRVAKLATQFPDTLFVQGDTSRKQVALTFDDGPDNRYTAQVLDILKSYHVHATFFVLGSMAKEHPELVRRMVQEGHVVGNHTWNHKNITKLTPAALREEVKRTEDELAGILGYRTFLFRPPYGAINVDALREISHMHFKVVDWTVDTFDWRENSKEKIANNVFSGVKNGSIILQHCAGGPPNARQHSVDALPIIIDGLQKKGFQLVTIQEMLHTPVTSSRLP